VGDIATLLGRDHDELDRMVSFLISLEGCSSEWWDQLDAVRLAFAAHAEAQDLALLRKAASKRVLGRFIAHVAAAHGAQERLIDRLFDTARPPEARTMDALELCSLMRSHAEQERLIHLPQLREGFVAEDYARLAPSYAAERIRALGALVPVLPPRS
jgi:hypothetical protein